MDQTRKISPWYIVRMEFKYKSMLKSQIKLWKCSIKTKYPSIFDSLKLKKKTCDQSVLVPADKAGNNL